MVVGRRPWDYEIDVYVCVTVGWHVRLALERLNGGLLERSCSTAGLLYRLRRGARRSRQCRESGEYKNKDLFKHCVWPYLDSTLGVMLLLRALDP